MHIPDDWMPDARMERVILHWTGGTHRASANDRKHYHILIEGDGSLVQGVPSIAANAEGSALRPRASHTLNCNSGSIGLSMCAMGGPDVREFPFEPGRWPLAEIQWKAAASVVAQLCARYRLPIQPETVLSHAEVQGTLGIRQRGKWDITRLPWNDRIVGARACGDIFRSMVRASPLAPTLLPTPIARPTLREGASGDYVVGLQIELSEAGYAVSRDGHFGPITTRAVQAFQRSRGLTPDGVVGPATWKALEA